jgi:hypothetical protein
LGACGDAYISLEQMHIMYPIIIYQSNFSVTYKSNKSQFQGKARLSGDVGCEVWEHIADMRLLISDMLIPLWLIENPFLLQ